MSRNKEIFKNSKYGRGCSGLGSSWKVKSELRKKGALGTNIKKEPVQKFNNLYGNTKDPE